MFRALTASLSKVNQAATLEVDDVFATTVRNGTGADVTITHNIDMTQGFLLLTKNRAAVVANAVNDSARGVTQDLTTTTTAAQTTQATGLKSVSTVGYTVGALAKMNVSGGQFIDWTFRKAPKFFDIVTYVGDGTTNRVLNHALTLSPGLVVVKAANGSGDWNTRHRSGTGELYLNLNAGQGGSYSELTGATATTFTVSGVANTLNVTYVAYLIAHDTATDGWVQCGSLSTTGTGGNATATLGWEPQALILKKANVVSDWELLDVQRGLCMTPSLPVTTNTTAVEGTTSIFSASPTPTGFVIATGAASETVFYVAIRRHTLVPTSGTQVFNTKVGTGTGAAVSITGLGFTPSAMLAYSRAAAGRIWIDKVRGKTSMLDAIGTAAEVLSGTGLTSWDMDGVTLGSNTAVNGSGTGYVYYFLRRALKFFDVACYTGDGASPRNLPHNLGVKPELIIQKARNNTTKWEVNSDIFGSGVDYWYFDTDNNKDTTGGFVPAPTATTFGASAGGGNTNLASNTYVAYLFASLAGVSKVGTYTGNGTSQTINCNFTAGARFVLIKQVSGTPVGDWLVFDTVRGIVAGNDPRIASNRSDIGEITTDDSLDPAASGFIVNQVAASNINVTNSVYLFLAIA